MPSFGDLGRENSTEFKHIQKPSYRLDFPTVGHTRLLKHLPNKTLLCQTSVTSSLIQEKRLAYAILFPGH